MRAIDPHVTEVVVLVEPIEFPLKIPYEKTNGTIEGLRDRDAGDQDDEEIEDEDDDDDQDDGDDGERKRPKVKDKGKEDEPKLLHYSEGIASDGVIYVNDVGDEVKLDSRGRAYRVGSDGRKLMPSKRPVGYVAPEEWAKMSAKERESSTKAADDIAREKVEKDDRDAKKKKKKEKKDKRRVRRRMMIQAYLTMNPQGRMDSLREKWRTCSKP